MQTAYIRSIPLLPVRLNGESDRSVLLRILNKPDLTDVEKRQAKNAASLFVSRAVLTDIAKSEALNQINIYIERHGEPEHPFAGVPRQAFLLKGALSLEELQELRSSLTTQQRVQGRYTKQRFYDRESKNYDQDSDSDLGSGSDLFSDEGSDQGSDQGSDADTVEQSTYEQSEYSESADEEPSHKRSDANVHDLTVREVYEKVRDQLPRIAQDALDASELPAYIEKLKISDQSSSIDFGAIDGLVGEKKIKSAVNAIRGKLSERRRPGFDALVTYLLDRLAAKRQEQLDPDELAAFLTAAVGLLETLQSNRVGAQRHIEAFARYLA